MSRRELGFKLNPYGPCVANKDIDGTQCTICWYVDDTKISHKDHNVVSDIIQEIEDKFGKMTVTRGKRHVFVGIDIEFVADGTLRLSMDDYVKECIEIYGDKINKSAPAPAKGDLFDSDVGMMAEQLTEKEADKLITLQPNYCTYPKE